MLPADPPAVPALPPLPPDATDRQKAIYAAAASAFAAVTLLVLLALGVDTTPGPGPDPTTTTTTAPTSSSSSSSSSTSSSIPAGLERLDNPAGIRNLDEQATATQADMTATAFTAADPWTSLVSPVDNGPSPQGQFRLICTASHWRADDPIIHPARPGAAHLHLFFGNALTDAFSTGPSLLETGGTTCQGGPLNRSAYWMPALLDAAGRPVVPKAITLYYKTYRPGTASELPQGLQLLYGLGPDGAVSPSFTARESLSWGCYTDGISRSQRATIPGTVSPPCPAGTDIQATIQFPQCLAVDAAGRPVLSSDNHIDHAYHLEGEPLNQRSPCPASHPYEIPQISYLVRWSTPSSAAGWHLSCDHDVDGNGAPDQPGGCLHADWFGAWNDRAVTVWHDGCIRAARNCSLGQTSTARRFAPIVGPELRNMEYTGPQVPTR